LQSTVSNDLHRLLVQAERDSAKPQSFQLAKGGALPVPAGTHAHNVKFGFKAPVAMTLMPWWKEVCPHLMFIHVTRDGRDIAFSANQVCDAEHIDKPLLCTRLNVVTTIWCGTYITHCILCEQGPVQKFYNSMYRKSPYISETNPPVKGIRLWSDWNNGIRKWSEKQEKEASGGPQDKSFRYLRVHTEDIVSDEISVKFNAIKQVAAFVGSGQLIVNPLLYTLWSTHMED
jgi:hypothetical protein